MAYTGVPRIVCEGTPLSIGLAHGRGAKKRITDSIACYTLLYQETANIGWGEARKRALAFEDTIKTVTPHLHEEMKGVAMGAGVDFEDILTLNVRSEIVLTNYSDGCTSVAKFDDNSAYLAQNWDWVEEAGNATVYLDVRAPGKPRILLLGEAGIVGKFGMNDSGLGVCMNAIKSGALSTNKLPVHIAMRKILECDSFESAKTTLDTLGTASTVNFMIADRTGNFGTLECSPRGHKLILPSGDERAVWHTNHLYAPDLPDGVRDFPSANSFSRLQRIKELSTGKPASVEAIRGWLSDEEGSPTGICRSRPPGAIGVDRMVTLATIVIDLLKLEMHVSFGRPSLAPPVEVLSFS